MSELAYMRVPAAAAAASVVATATAAAAADDDAQSHALLTIQTDQVDLQDAELAATAAPAPDADADQAKEAVLPPKKGASPLRWAFRTACGLVACALLALVVVVVVDVRRTPNIRVETTRVSLRAETLAVKQDQVSVHTALRVGDGPKHVSVALQSAVCQVALQRDQELTSLLSVQLNVGDLPVALTWNSALADADSTALTVQLTNLNIAELRALASELIQEQDATLASPTLKVDCAINAHISLLGMGMGQWDVNHGFEMAIDESSKQTITDAFPSAPAQTDNTLAQLSQFSFNVPFRMPTTGVFADLRSFIVETPLVHQNLMLDASNLQALSAIRSLQFIQNKLPEIATGLGVEFILYPAELELASGASSDDAAMLHFNVRPIVKGVSDAQPCVVSESSSSSSDAHGLKMRMQACEQPQTTIVQQLLGDSHEMELRPTFPVPHNNEVEYCLDFYLNARAVTDVGACFSLTLLNDPSFVEEVSIRVNVSSLLKLAVVERTTITSDSLEVSVQSEVARNGNIISFASFNLFSPLTSKGDARLYFWETADPNAVPSIARVSSDYSVAYTIQSGTPYDLLFAGTTTWTNYITYVHARAIVDPAGVATLSIGQGSAEGPASLRSLARYEAQWQHGTRTLVHANGTMWNFADKSEISTLDLTLDLPSSLAGKAVFKLIEAKQGPLDPNTARLAVVYTLDGATTNGLTLGLYGDIVFQQRLLSTASFSLGFNTVNKVFHVTVSESQQPAPITPDTERFGLVYTGQYGGPFMVQIAGQIVLSKNILTNADVYISGGSNFIQVSVLESSTVAAPTTDNARFATRFHLEFDTDAGFKLGAGFLLEYQQAVITNAALHITTSNRLVSFLIEEGAVADLAPLTSRFAAKYDVAWEHQGHWYNVQANGTTWARAACLSNALTTFDLNTYDNTWNIGVTESADWSAATTNTRVDAQYQGSWGSMSYYNARVSGRTYISGDLITNAKVTFAGDEFFANIAFLESTTVEDPTTDNARIDVAYYSDYHFADGVSINLAGHTTYDQTLLSNVAFKFERHSTADQSAATTFSLVESPSQNLQPFSSRVALLKSVLWTKIDGGGNWQANTTTVWNWQCLASKQLALAIDTAQRTWQFAMLEGRDPYPLVPTDAGIALQYAGGWQTGPLVISVQGQTYTNRELMSNAVLNLAASGSATQIKLLETASLDTPTVDTARVNLMYEATYALNTGLTIVANGYTIVDQVVLSNAELKVSGSDSTASLTLQEGTVKDISPTSSRVSVDYTAGWTFTDGFNTTVSGTAYANSTCLSNALASFAFSSTEKTFGLVVREAGSSEPLTIPAGRIDAQYAGKWDDMSAYSARIAGRTYVDTSIATNAIVTFLGNQYFAHVRILESGTEADPSESYSRVFIDYNSDHHFVDGFQINANGYTIIDNQYVSNAAVKLSGSPSGFSVSAHEGLATTLRADNMRFGIDTAAAWSTSNGFSTQLNNTLYFDHTCITNAYASVGFSSSAQTVSIVVQESNSPYSTAGAISRLDADYGVHYKTGPFQADVAGRILVSGEVVSHAILVLSSDINFSGIHTYSFLLRETASADEPDAINERLFTGYTLAYSTSPYFTLGITGATNYETRLVTNVVARFILDSASNLIQVLIIEGDNVSLTSENTRFGASYIAKKSVTDSTFTGSLSGATTIDQVVVSNVQADFTFSQVDADFLRAFTIDLKESSDASNPRLTASYKLDLTTKDSMVITAGGSVALNGNLLTNSSIIISDSATGINIGFLESPTNKVDINSARYGGGLEVLVGSPVSVGALAPLESSSPKGDFIISSYAIGNSKLIFDAAAHLLFNFQLESRALELSEMAPFVPMALWRVAAAVQMPLAISFYLMSVYTSTIAVAASFTTCENCDPVPTFSSSTGGVDSSTGGADSSSSTGGDAPAISHDKKGLTAGQKAGIGVGVSIGILALIALAWLLLTRCRLSRDAATRAEKHVSSETYPDTYKSLDV